MKNKNHILFLMIVVVLTVFAGLSFYVFRPTSVETYNKEIKGLQEAEQNDLHEQNEPPKMASQKQTDVLVKGESL